MTTERRKEIETEAKRRVDLWILNSSFNDMTVYGSYMRFNMAIGLLGGYPFKNEPWMIEDDFNGFVTENEFHSVEYDTIIEGLFSEQYTLVHEEH